MGPLHGVCISRVCPWLRKSLIRPSEAPSAASIPSDIPDYTPTYIKSRAEAGFRELAAASGGEAHPLDVNSKDGAQLLTDAVCKQILSSLGGKSLADAYERMKPSFN